MPQYETGKIHKIKVKDIKIPDNRFGDRNKNLQPMTASLNQFGLLQPIIVEMRGDEPWLIAGYRRTCGALMLEWDTIDAMIADEMTPFQRRRIELEENVQRENLSWAEKATALAELDRLKKKEDPEWTSSMTAEMVGQDKGHVSKQLQLVKEMENDPTIANAATLRGALERLTRKKQLESMRQVVKMRRVRGEQLTATVHCGDARILIRGIEDESVDAVVTDPPFGIDLTLKGRGDVFDDNPEYADDLIREMLPELYRVLRPDSWLAIFYDLDKMFLSKPVEQLLDYCSEGPESWYNEELVISAGGLRWWLKEAGFNLVSSIPCVWTKPDKQVGRSSPKTNIVHAYEGFLFAAKGDPRMYGGKCLDVFDYEVHRNQDRVHPIQKPTELMAAIVARVAIPGQLILDPFAGGGSTGLGALEIGCDFVGFELDKNYAEAANTILNLTEVLD